jgi:hypothetical protein
MKKLTPILIILLLFISVSCTSTECKDCTKKINTEFSIGELDSIVQNIELYNSDTLYYESWNQFMDSNFRNSELDIDSTEEVCSKSGFMVSVDPLGDKEEINDHWYSNGLKDSDSLFDINDESIFLLGTMYYDCD